MNVILVFVHLRPRIRAAVLGSKEELFKDLTVCFAGIYIHSLTRLLKKANCNLIKKFFCCHLYHPHPARPHQGDQQLSHLAEAFSTSNRHISILKFKISHRRTCCCNFHQAPDALFFISSVLHESPPLNPPLSLDSKLSPYFFDGRCCCNFLLLQLEAAEPAVFTSLPL